MSFLIPLAVDFLEPYFQKLFTPANANDDRANSQNDTSYDSTYSDSSITDQSFNSDTEYLNPGSEFSNG